MTRRNWASMGVREIWLPFFIQAENEKKNENV
jgi:hypothetical protein